jgi:hypothetical protein
MLEKFKSLKALEFCGFLKNFSFFGLLEMVCHEIRLLDIDGDAWYFLFGINLIRSAFFYIFFFFRRWSRLV